MVAEAPPITRSENTRPLDRQTGPSFGEKARNQLLTLRQKVERVKDGVMRRASGQNKYQDLGNLQLIYTVKVKETEDQIEGLGDKFPGLLPEPKEETPIGDNKETATTSPDAKDEVIPDEVKKTKDEHPENGTSSSIQEDHMQALEDRDIEPTNNHLPLAYPDELSTKTDQLTHDDINHSINAYLSWRRAHENNEGVLEPGRANVLCHATSVNNAVAVAGEGHLRSIRNVLTSTNAGLEDMQGGKAPFIAARIKDIASNNPEFQQQVVQHRDEIAHWIEERVIGEYIDAIGAIREATTYQEVLDAVESAKNFTRRGFTIGGTVSTTNKEWLFMARYLNQDERTQVADQSGAEGYISTTLGHALEKYTPARDNASYQAAIILDVDSIAMTDRYVGGGTANLQPISSNRWEAAVQQLQNNPSHIHLSEYGNETREPALEISVNGDEQKGTEVDLSSRGLVIIPESQKTYALSKLPPESVNQVFFFDDTQFESVDEVVGWLTTTPEGRKQLSTHQFSSFDK